MSTTIDFSQELEQIEAQLTTRRNLLAEVDPTAPHPTCPCERTHAIHLEEEIAGLELLQAFMQGDFAPLTEALGKEGPMYLTFVLAHVYKDSDSRLEQTGALLEKMKAAVMARTRGYFGFNPYRLN